jgi:hypothetical protein
MKKIACCAFCIILLTTISACDTTVAAEKQSSLAARIQVLEDREEVRGLLKDYGRFLDQRDFASFSQLFAEKEGEWVGGFGKAKSALAIRKLMEDTLGNPADKKAPPNYHLFLNDIIHINGNQADATTKWMFMVQGEKGGPQPFYLGHYEDTFIRENGRWKFLKRIVHTDMPTDTALSGK